MSAINPTLLRYLTASTAMTRTSWLPSLWRTIVVPEHGVALLYRDGRFIARLDPGLHRRFGMGWHADIVDLRRCDVVIAGQDLITADHNPVKVSALLAFSVADPLRVARAAQSPEEALHHAAQLALREVIAATTLDALLDRTGDLTARMTDGVRLAGAALGYAVEHLAVRDVMLSAELKRAFATVVTARQEGLAHLERARGEHAALRTLANAARLLDEHPALAQLKALQAIGDAVAKGGSTIVIGDSA